MPFEESNGSFNLFIDNDNPIDGKYDYNVEWILEKKLVFKDDGSIAVSDEDNL